MSSTLLRSLVPLASIAAFAACGEPYAEFAPVPVQGLSTVAQVSTGGRHTCAVLDNGNLACWGDNAHFQLGVAVTENLTSAPIYVPTPLDPIEVKSSGTHTCVRYDNGQVDCWGANIEGSLGFAPTCEEDDCQSARRQVAGVDDATALEVGGTSELEYFDGGWLPTAFSCAIRSNDSVMCWGANDYGQAGISPGLVVTEPTQLVDSGGFPFREVSDMALGDYHGCLLGEGNAVFCWGDVSNYQTGPGAGPAYLEGFDQRIVDLDAGGYHTCALGDRGAVYCWGNNINGQAGATSGNLDCGDYRACAAEPQRIGDVPPSIDIAAGQNHSCALTEAGDVYCWGSNQLGQLGVSEFSLSLPPRRVHLPEPAVDIDSGDAHTCALLESGILACWGANEFGQVGTPRER